MKNRFQISDFRLQGKGGMDKRGQLFPLWIVVLTLFLCGLSIGFYNVQQDNVAVSLVSPLSILELRDDLTVFEMREEELILDTLNAVDFEAEAFEEEFVSGIDADMREFIFSKMYYQEAKGEEMPESTRDSFLRNVLYSAWEDSGDLVLKRMKVRKSFVLSSGDWNVVNFPVEVDFEFEREYLISKVGGDFVVEVVE